MAGVTNKATLMMKQIGKPFNGDGLLAPLLDTSGIKLGVEFPLNTYIYK